MKKQLRILCHSRRRNPFVQNLRGRACACLFGYQSLFAGPHPRNTQRTQQRSFGYAGTDAVRSHRPRKESRRASDGNYPLRRIQHPSKQRRSGRADGHAPSLPHSSKIRKGSDRIHKSQGRHGRAEGSRRQNQDAGLNFQPFVRKRWVPPTRPFSSNPSMPKTPSSRSPGVSSAIAPHGSITSSREVVVWRPLPLHS